MGQNMIFILTKEMEIQQAAMQRRKSNSHLVNAIDAALDMFKTAVEAVASFRLHVFKSFAYILSTLLGIPHFLMSCIVPDLRNKFSRVNSSVTRRKIK